MANLVLVSCNLGPQSRRFPFESLPVEIIYYLAKLLPKESAISLALTNKAMYGILGPTFFRNLSVLEHWNLILLLERDSDLLVACQQCKKLHGPFQVTILGGALKSYFRSQAIPCLKERRFLLPPGITSAFCRLLAKRYIRHQPYADLLTMAVRTKVYMLSNFKFFSTTTLRIINGNLFVRHEQFIAPLTIQGDLTGRSAYLLNELLDHGFGNSRVCSHVQWQDLGLKLHHDHTSDHSSFNTDDRYATGHREGHGSRLPLTARSSRHNRDCYDSNPIPRPVLGGALGAVIKCALLHAQFCTEDSCHNLPTPHRINLVRGCEICATDMSLSAQDVEGIGRVMAMTTWKKLGGVEKGQWDSWYSHYRDVYDFTKFFIRTGKNDRFVRDVDKGTTVYAAFEKVYVPPNGEVPVGWYTPTLSRRVTTLFAGEPNISDSDWSLCIPRQDFDSY